MKRLRNKFRFVHASAIATWRVLAWVAALRSAAPRADSCQMRIGNKHRILHFTLLLAILGCVGWLALGQPDEPVYEGQPLTYWLEHYFPVASRPPGGSGLMLPDPQAVRAIRLIGTNAIPTLLRLTRAQDSRPKTEPLSTTRNQELVPVRLGWGQTQWARIGFSVLGAAASNAVPALIEIFNAKLSRSSQEAAASALGSIGPPAQRAAPALAHNLADTNSFAHLECVRALGRIQAEPQLVVPALVNCLNDSHPGVRQLAIEGLGQFGADAEPAVPALLEICDRNTVESPHAATALGLIGPAAKPAVPSLLRGLPDANRDLEFRLQCILALGRIHAEPELVVPALMKSMSETLADTDVRIRAFSTTALGQYGPKAQPAVPLLLGLLHDPNQYVRSEATNALRLIDSVSAVRAGIK